MATHNPRPWRYGYAVVDKSPDYVVVGEGRTLSFEMLEHAVQMVLDGAQADRHQPRPELPDASRHAAGLRSDCLADRSGDGHQGI